jgi:TonB family protein
MNIIKFTAALLLFLGTVGASIAQDTPPQGCNAGDDKMGRGEIRQCIVRATEGISRLVIESRHGTISAYVNLNTTLRNHKTLVIRWDDEKAVTTAMNRSNDFEAMFFGNAQSAISKMAKSKTLMVESDTYRRGISVDTFPIFDGEAMANYIFKRTGSQPSPATSSAPAPDKLVQDLQIALNQTGFNAGTADGYMGQQTQAAIIAAQKKLGHHADGIPSKKLLDSLRATAALQSAFKDPQQTPSTNVVGYGAQVRACIQPGVMFPTPPRGSTNPATQYRADLRPDGTIASVKLTRSSGNPNFDRAVETGIRRCSPFPAPPSGKYPSYIDINYNMYD